MISTNLNLESYLTGNTKTANNDPLLGQSNTASSSAASSASTFEPAVNLDLSDAAKQMLAQLQQQQAAASASSSSSSSGSPTFNSPFSLTDAQTAKITGIIQSFKDEPISQDTFNKISDALKEAGFAPDRMAAMDAMSSFNSTGYLASLLSGDDSVAMPNFSQTMQNMQTKQQSYMQAISDYWAATTNATPDEGASTADSTTI